MEGSEPSPELIAEYVERLKDAYLFLRQRRRPSVKRIASGQDHLWKRAALALIQNEADPTEFVQFVFDKILVNHDDVYVNMVTSVALIGEFTEEAKPKRDKQLEVIVASQLHALATRIREGQDMRIALVDPDANFSAVFRHVVALGHGHHDIAGRYRSEAERMMRFKPHYRKLFKDWLGAEHGS